MTISVQITRGVESLFGTRDENIHLLEETLDIRTRLMNDSLEIEGEEANVVRAASILEDYAALVKEGQTFANGDLKSYLRVVAQDPEVTLRALVHSGKQRNFGKKAVAPKTVNQRRYVEAIERTDLTFGVGPAGTGKTYLAVAMAVSAYLNKRVSRIILTRPAVEAGERLGFLPGSLQEKVDPYLRPLYDAIYVASERLTEAKPDATRRRVLVLITDGGDNSIRKEIGYQKAVAEAQRAGAAIYPIIIMPILSDAGRNVAGEHALIQMAEDTGGKYFYVTEKEDLKAAFAHLSDDLRNQYLIGYYSPKRGNDSSLRRISVTLNDPTAAQTLSVRSKTGYYADAR